VFCGVAGKDTIHDLQKEWMSRIESLRSDLNSGSSRSDLETINPGLAKRFLEDKVDEEIHRGAIEDNKRADNRRFDEIRPLFAKAGGISPILHGSGIFYRGGTHVLTALTLGGPGDSLMIDTMEEQDKKKHFMHHYNFPPYSAGETGRMGGLNRRMIGHGALAEKALEAVIPEKEKFPYTIRVVSECLASNGSTSMGSVCASTLALMDGGVPIKNPVAGIAMGLMTHPSSTEASEGKQPAYRILTDIQGPEDEFGGMDFKVAGTRDGITAIQLDIKLDGIPVPVLVDALAAAKKARFEILDVIEKEISAPRANISPRAPEIISMRVRPDQIGLVIGGGGKTINGIKEVSGVSDITIEDDGSVFITGTGGTAGKAREMIEALVKEYKPGEVYDGEVTRLMDFGAFVRIGPGKDAEGLVHVSEIAPFRIEKAGDAVAVGEKVRVMIKEIDEKGRVNLSIKAVDPEFATRKGVKPSQNNGPRPDRSPRPPRREF
jgi:polyribonucleotide nucleotidyltransferase